MFRSGPNAGYVRVRCWRLPQLLLPQLSLQPWRVPDAAGAAAAVLALEGFVGPAMEVGLRPPSCLAR